MIAVKFGLWMIVHMHESSNFQLSSYKSNFEFSFLSDKSSDFFYKGWTLRWMGWGEHVTPPTCQSQRFQKDFPLGCNEMNIRSTQLIAPGYLEKEW